MNDDLEKLKSDMRRRRHPRRRDARVQDDPQHNPLIQADCKTCRGRGEVHFIRDEAGHACHDRRTCDACAGSGLSGEIERYFDVDDDVIDVDISAVGMVRCPRCGWRFDVVDRDRWSGLRHLRCGQALRIVTR